MDMYGPSVSIVILLVSLLVAVLQVIFGFFVYKYRPSLEMGIATLLFGLRSIFFIYGSMLPQVPRFLLVIFIGFEVMLVYRSIRGTLGYPVTVRIDLTVFVVMMGIGLFSSFFLPYMVNQIIFCFLVLFFFGKAFVLSLKSQQRKSGVMSAGILLYLAALTAVMSPFNVDIGLYDTDPTYTWIIVATLLLFLVGNYGLFFSAVIRTTEQYREQRDFARTLIFTIGHDLNGYLGGIRQVLGILENQTDPALPLISDNVTKATNLLTDLVYWGRSRCRESEKDNSIITPGNLMRDVLEDASSYIEMKDLTVSLPESLNNETICVDRIAAAVVFRNIVSNAVKFSPRGGVITIRFLLDGERQGLSIGDKGPGMPDSIIKQVRAGHPVTSNAGSSGEKGMGMGLRIVTSICWAHQWSVELLSGPSSGTEVIIWFPQIEC